MEIPQTRLPIKRRTATIIPFPRPRAGVDPRRGRSRARRAAICTAARWPTRTLADLTEDERREIAARAIWPERPTDEEMQAMWDGIEWPS